MDIQRIRYFLEVVRHRNFSQAARTCHVSQPSLSQQIMKLEEEVGGSLLLRSRGRVELTEHGRAFLKHAQAIMAEVQSAEVFVGESQGKTRGTLRIGAIPTIAPYLIPKLFARIKKAHPEVRLELVEDVTASLAEALRIGGIDFALLSPDPLIDAEAESLLLLKDRLLLTLPRKHPLCEQPKVEVRQLKQEQAILLEQSHCLSKQAASYCEAVGLGAHVIIRASQIETLLGLVEQGFGFTFTPEIAVGHHRHRKVLFREIASKPYDREIRLYWTKRHVLPRLHQAVIDNLLRGY